jgi:ribosomal protein L23
MHVTFDFPFKTYYYVVWFLEMNKIIFIFLHDHDIRKQEVAKHVKMMFKDNCNSMTINVNKKMQRIAIYFQYGHEMQVLLPLGQMIRHKNTMQC